MNAADLLDRARSETGLENFGDDSFREPMERMIASINAESELSEIGAQLVPGMLLRWLTNRLKIEETYRRHPEIEDQEIVRPLFVTGLPRTGTTALGHMLATDPNTRSLRFWEAALPCPPDEMATECHDPRIAQVQAESDIANGLIPGIENAVPLDIKGPDECFKLTSFAFMTSAMEGLLRVPSYVAWVLDARRDMVPAYLYHRRVLKLLQWRYPPRRWSLRSPIHLYAPEAINTIYPDAQFCITHRAPALAMPSAASLMLMIRKVFLADPHARELGRELPHEYATGLERMMAFRERVGEARFTDIAHRDQLRDPVTGIRALYAKLGWAFDEAQAGRIHAWSEHNPKGLHKPDPATFSFDFDEMARLFARYEKRYAAFL